MKIFGYPGSSCTRKVWMLLHEKGATADLVTIDLARGEQRSPQNPHPFAKVPVLEDGEFLLYESDAILRYLDDRLTGPRLTSRDVQERARAEQWMSVAASYLNPPALTLMEAVVWGPARGRATDMASAREALILIARVLDVAEETLRRSSWLGGGAISLADIAWAPYVQKLVDCGVGVLLDDRASVSRWWRGIAERPSWQATCREMAP